MRATWDAMDLRTQATASALPINDVLGPLATALELQTRAVLTAPPGAGKTTIVPLALLGAQWLAGRRILMLEPRRLAARAAASRMADILGERVGETVGVRARLATKVGPTTRIEVVTEGVFTRMIIDDPALEGVGAVIFDEFHERSLDGDLGLALALDAQSGLREDLRLLVMSATLGGVRVSGILRDAPSIESLGRAFAVETHYLGRPDDGGIERAVARAIGKALTEEPGSILVFVPGQREIERVNEMLRETLGDRPIDVVPLYGALELKAQDRALRAAPEGRRKVVLASAIAETSLTIEGVRIVIDAGFARVPRFDAGARITRLETVRASRASVDQRRGRAGRTEPGVCYRLWHEPETQGLRPYETPEILAADLCGLLLDCAAWGVVDPYDLTWLDPPPEGALASARAALKELGALDTGGRLSERGRALRDLAMPPHLAAMVLDGARSSQGDVAARLAVLLVERGIGGRGVDLEERMRRFDVDRSLRARRLRELAERWAKTAQRLVGKDEMHPATQRSVGGLLAIAFPDRIAKRRGSDGRLLMASGRGAVLDPLDPLSSAELLVVAALQGAAAGARILAAARLDVEELDVIAGKRIKDDEEVQFDGNAKAVRARRTRRLGAIVLRQDPVKIVRDTATASELVRGIVDHFGLMALPWSKVQRQFVARVNFLRDGDPDWPDLSDARLRRDSENWLAPFLVGKASLDEITANDLGNALDVLVPWELRQRLDAQAPTHFVAPTGSRIAIDYEGEHAPSVAVRVQELYGLNAHPTIAGGRLALTLTLLSPAQRPIQVTRDLPAFWVGSWRDVKAEMKGRYPKHVWPDDPANAEPTRRAKGRP